MTDILTAGQDFSATAARILDAAAQLFMQRGYSAVSINDIVRAAQVTKPTLYYYFPDKEELFVQMVLRKLAEMHAALAVAVHHPAGLMARLVAAADVLLNYRDSDMRMMRHEMREHLSPENQQRLNAVFHQQVLQPLRSLMQQGRDEHLLARHSTAHLTMLFLGMMEAFHAQPTGGAAHAPAQRSDLSLDPAMFSAEVIVDLFLHGVAAKR